MRKRISEAAFQKATRAPRQRFSSLSITPGREVCAESGLPKDSHCVWFERNLVHQEDEAFYFDDKSYSVYMFVDAVLSVVFYVEDGRLLSASFSARLNADQLVLAVREMRKLGLGRHVVAAARMTLQHIPPGAREVLGKTLEMLARTTGRARTRGTR